MRLTDKAHTLEHAHAHTHSFQPAFQISTFKNKQTTKAYVTSEASNTKDRAKQNKTKIDLGDFPGGAVVKNPPANAGDTGSIPGLGRSHMPQSN